MAFAKTTWVDNATPDLTATQLNRIETGIGDLHSPELWHYVSVGGDPAQFTNGYTNYGAGTQSAMYRKLADGKVLVRGLVKKNDAITQTSMFALPLGYRPQVMHIFAVDCGSGHARVNVNPDGTVVLWTGNASSYLALDPIEFYID